MDITRIKNNVNIQPNGCWLWNKSITSAGYGQLTENKIYWTTHRYAYTCVNGQIPDGYLIRHKCHTPACCNPDHMLLGTSLDNWNDSADKYKKINETRMKPLLVNGVKYDSVRSANEKLGISFNSLIKYTKDGVFDLVGYRLACNRARVIPKV